MAETSLRAGFTDAPREAAVFFRLILNAMARPGLVQDVSGVIPPAPLSPAAGAALLTLCDPETGLFLAGDADCDATRTWLAFHTGAPKAAAENAAFAYGTWDALAPHLDAFPIGSAQYPDRSATLIVEVPTLDGGLPLRGPGIQDVTHLPVPDPDWSRANRALYPRGIDLILTCGTLLAALPRTTRIG